MFRRSLLLSLIGIGVAVSSVSAGEPVKAQRAVSLQIKIISMSEEMMEKFMTLTDFPAEKAATPGVLLSDRQVRGWLELMQGDRATQVMMTPHMKSLEGQPARLQVGGQVALTKNRDGQKDNKGKPAELEFADVGLTVEVIPQIAGDGKTVRLQMQVVHAEMVTENVQRKVKLRGSEEQVEALGIEQRLAKMILEKNLEIPPQKTMACFLGRRISDVRTEHRVPVLSQLPVVSRLFTNVGFGRETTAVFVFITAEVDGPRANALFPPEGVNSAPVRVHGGIGP